MKTGSIGINAWLGESDFEVIGSRGEGDSRVTAYMRDDGSFALETNGDPVFGALAEDWIEENFPGLIGGAR